MNEMEKGVVLAHPILGDDTYFRVWNRCRYKATGYDLVTYGIERTKLRETYSQDNTPA